MQEEILEKEELDQVETLSGSPGNRHSIGPRFFVGAVAVCCIVFILYLFGLIPPLVFHVAFLFSIGALLAWRKVMKVKRPEDGGWFIGE